jgi:RNA polymerase sigma-70 factor, ECF subfamily
MQLAGPHKVYRVGSTDAVMEAPMEAELVRRAQQGDRVAFERLAGSIVDRLHGVSYSILSDAHLAEDATQQALIDIWRDLPKLRDPDRFGGWSYRILVRACHAEARRTPKWLSDVTLPTRTDPGGEDGLGAIVLIDQLERGFRRLSVEQRSVVVLHHYADLTLEQVADALDVPLGTVHSRLSRAMKLLRAGLEADGRSPSQPEEVPEAAR